MTNQTIDGVPRECRECGSAALSWFAQNTVPNGIQQNRLNTSDVQCVFVLGCDDCSETLKIISADKIAEHFNKPAAQPQGEPVTIEAVAVTRDNGDGSLRLEWLLEGGIANMEFAGMVLFAIPEANDLCDESGSAEVYLSPQSAEQPAPVAVVMPERPRADEEEYERMTDYEKGLLHGGIELWDKISSALNTK